MLPEVERLLRSLTQLKAEYDEVDSELTHISERIALLGGTIPPRDQAISLRTRKESAARGLKSAVERIQETGCQLKDLQMGLVDFPTLYGDREVYLCWKLGEHGIGFWHPVEDGFKGRRPIDCDFLKNHHGGD